MTERRGRPPSSEPRKVFTVIRVDSSVKEALDAEVRRLEPELGFKPTLSQVVHRLILRRVQP